MKLTELIKELEEILETRGDLMLKDEIEVLVELRQVETMQLNLLYKGVKSERRIKI